MSESGVAQIEAVPGNRHKSPSGIRTGAGTVGPALVLVLAVIGFEQFLHTSPAAQSGSAVYGGLYWLSDALLAFPLAAVAVWGGGRIADRLGFRLESVWIAFARAGVIALLFAIALIPGWFLHDDVDRLARTVAVTSGHSHGHGGAHDDEVHWAGDAVFRALILVPLAAAAVWGGEQAGRRCSAGVARARSLLVRAGVIGVLLALALISAWWLERAADRADTGPLTYTNALVPGAAVRPVPAHTHHRAGAHAHLAAVSVAAVTTEGALGDRVAHAFRDGLAGQAVGLPVLFLAFLWRRRTPVGARPGWFTAEGGGGDE